MITTVSEYKTVSLITYIAKDKLITILFITDCGKIHDYLLIIYSLLTLIIVIDIIQGLLSVSGILPSKDTIYIANKSEHYYPVYKLST